MITPLQYHGQEEKEDYVQATILLDGSHGTLGMQRILDLPIDEVRTGLRVEAVWRPSPSASGRCGAATSRSATRSPAGGRPANPTPRLEQYADYIV